MASVTPLSVSAQSDVRVRAGISEEMKRLVAMTRVRSKDKPPSYMEDVKSILYGFLLLVPTFLICSVSLMLCLFGYFALKKEFDSNDQFRLQYTGIVVLYAVGLFFSTTSFEWKDARMFRDVGVSIFIAIPLLLAWLLDVDSQTISPIVIFLIYAGYLVVAGIVMVALLMFPLYRTLSVKIFVIQFISSLAGVAHFTTSSYLYVALGMEGMSKVFFVGVVYPFIASVLGHMLVADILASCLLRIYPTNGENESTVRRHWCMLTKQVFQMTGIISVLMLDSFGEVLLSLISSILINVACTAVVALWHSTDMSRKVVSRVIGSKPQSNDGSSIDSSYEDHEEISIDLTRATARQLFSDIWAAQLANGKSYYILRAFVEDVGSRINVVASVVIVAAITVLHHGSLPRVLGFGVMAIVAEFIEALCKRRLALQIMRRTFIKVTPEWGTKTEIASVSANVCVVALLVVGAFKLHIVSIMNVTRN
mmetsp:Transcript_16550/g.28681  ORF Transcript_16550/g.28681 Transcript_16550/m.28681 type:complete len:479 (-) Transcript_16550:295-1731(-)|eukprot:CAMPEP_0203755768 /NCGR_PEP_ID=MMETSP0098-20131031/9159_1 /ASSEMBLY_ACC=CAM_ASM_000208 /TAXON_ID=96639 /ORGANISM=" , Strain NY0313808BC1" /LENGTH=478 /DNA_ID=CAMNT_0050647363 /DNA_START=165 /DNA_END=1601 /DNA_ORIENTATION=-